MSLPRHTDAANARTIALKRAGRLLSIAAAVAVSLISFPSVVPWMIAGWLAWSSVELLRGSAGWSAPVLCVGILAIKRTAWMPELVVLAAALLAAAGMLAVIGKRDTAWCKRLAVGATAGLWCLWAIVAVGWHGAAHCGRYVPLRGSRPVVCLGDSVTAGVSRRAGYPQYLGQRIALPVVDLSVPGSTSADALKKLPAMLEANPQAVIVELGGNDFLRGAGQSEVRANLEQIVAACRKVGAEVILMEVPRGFVTDAYGGLERKLARQHDLELIPDTAIRKLFLWSPHGLPGMWCTRSHHLSDDGLHPNVRGARYLAEQVADTLARIYGDAVRKCPSPDDRLQSVLRLRISHARAGLFRTLRLTAQDTAETSTEQPPSCLLQQGRSVHRHRGRCARAVRSRVQNRTPYELMQTRLEVLKALGKSAASSGR